MLRELVYTLVRRSGNENKAGRAYNIFMSAVACASVVPLMFKTTNDLLELIDIITVYLLFFDYILRWLTNDYASGKKAPWAFVIYPFMPFAIIDLVSLLPSMGLMSHGFRILRMLRIFKLVHYSESFEYVSNVFRREKRTLLSVLMIALVYIYISALAMFSYEPDTFQSFFHALYWATTALTTVGYGDVYPRSEIGQLISMISSLFGIAIIAMPAGIVTGGFVEEMNRKKQAQVEKEANKALKKLERIEKLENEITAKQEQELVAAHTQAAKEGADEQ